MRNGERNARAQAREVGVLRMPEAVKESMDAARRARRPVGCGCVSHHLDILDARRETRSVLSRLRALRGEERERFGVKP